MPVPTPFHPRTTQLCKSLLWKDWAGYYAVRSYDTYPDREYFAIRHSAGLIDVTPLFKYEVKGPDAASFLTHITVRNIRKLKPNQVAYCCWCDDDGKMIDDGTVARLEEDYFRVTSTEPNLAWFQRFTRGYDVAIEDSTDKLAALSLQGPNSRAILEETCGSHIASLKYFYLTRGKIDGVNVFVSRTGYTGDLGYEIWVDSGDALRLYDAVLSGGQPFGLLPAGLDAMDVTRIEAGFILNGVDYFNANHCVIERRKSTPYELGLGWMVNLKKGPFNGAAALRKEKVEGSKRVLVAIETDWDEFERIHDEFGLPPELSTAAWRDPRPVYDEAGRQAGYATSGAWSPTLKRNLALVTVQPTYQEIGTKLRFEVTIEYERRTIAATVVKKPCFDPERKRAQCA